MGADYEKMCKADLTVRLSVAASSAANHCRFRKIILQKIASEYRHCKGLLARLGIQYTPALQVLQALGYINVYVAYLGLLTWLRQNGIDPKVCNGQ